MINLQQVIDFAHSQGFINENEKQQLINEQLTLYNNLEKLKERKFERNEGYILHYDSGDIFCECQICKKKSHNFYEIYEPSVHLNCEPQLYTTLTRINILFVILVCKRTEYEQDFYKISRNQRIMI